MKKTRLVFLPVLTKTAMCDNILLVYVIWKGRWALLSAGLYLWLNCWLRQEISEN